jgi:hypothetical protein
MLLRRSKRNTFDTGGKPSTWLPPGGLGADVRNQNLMYLLCWVRTHAQTHARARECPRIRGTETQLSTRTQETLNSIQTLEIDVYHKIPNFVFKKHMLSLHDICSI